MKYHGWLYWVLWAAYDAAFLILAIIGILTPEQYFAMAMLFVLVVGFCRGLEYHSLQCYAEDHYPEDWSDHLITIMHSGWIRPMSRFSFVFLNEVENDPDLLTIKKNNRAALQVFWLGLVFAIVPALVLGWLQKVV